MIHAASFPVSPLYSNFLCGDRWFMQHANLLVVYLFCNINAWLGIFLNKNTLKKWEINLKYFCHNLIYMHFECQWISLKIEDEYLQSTHHIRHSSIGASAKSLYINTQTHIYMELIWPATYILHMVFFLHFVSWAVFFFK